jgi:FkbM family methyltransferase
MVVSLVLGLFLGVVWGINTARGWLNSTWLIIPLTLLVQVGLVRWLPLSTVEGIIIFGIVSQLPNLFVSVAMMMRGFRHFPTSAGRPWFIKRKLWRAFLRVIPSQWRLPVHFWGCQIAGYVEPEMYLIRHWKNRHKIAIDVGANEGIYSFEMARWFRKVEAFDPNGSISAHILAYNPSRITLHSVALSSSAGEAKFHVPISPSGASLVGWGTLEPELLASSSEFSETPKFEEFSVTTRTLDSYAFDDVAFIKIDVEGHEEQVLHGSRETINRWRPVILVEARFAARSTVERFLLDLDYRMFFLRANTLHELGRSNFALADNHENFFGIPSEKTSAITR